MGQLPIGKAEAQRATRWLMTHFGDAIRAAAKGKAYGPEHLCAIACQETAIKWLPWIDRLTPEAILALCVFDASGDYPGTTRSAFPRDAAQFRARYGAAFTEQLIEAYNRTRRQQGWTDRSWIGKGYGLFQYDLQHVQTDERFFREAQWRDFGACLERCCRVLDDKLRAKGGDLWAAIRAYNGSGAAADLYRENVRQFTVWCAEALPEAIKAQPKPRPWWLFWAWW